MRTSRNQSFTGTTRAFSMSLRAIGTVAPLFFLLSCSSIAPFKKGDTATVPATTVSPRFSIVYVIHGDGSYLYHDQHGNERRADEEALVGAKAVAMQNPEAEVFIFHEKRRRRFLRLLWPLRDGAFYYYRNGRLVASASYRRGEGAQRFDPEVAFYNKFGSQEHPGGSKLFLYFGHEIPEFGGTGYDASYRKRPFTVEDLAGGLRRFGRGTSKFDLVILSTCFNGTPHTVSTLAPYAKYIVASPDNLHLSFFDDEPLVRLDLGLEEGDMGTFANTFARESFNRLANDVQTVVSVAVYDVDLARKYVSAVDSMYVGAMAGLYDEATVFVEHYDCAENPAYTLAGMRDGVEIYYRPARFGRGRLKQGHSGWECVRPPSIGSDTSGF